MRSELFQYVSCVSALALLATVALPMGCGEAADQEAAWTGTGSATLIFQGQNLELESERLSFLTPADCSTLMAGWKLRATSGNGGLLLDVDALVPIGSASGEAVEVLAGDEDLLAYEPGDTAASALIKFEVEEGPPTLVGRAWLAEGGSITVSESQYDPLLRLSMEAEATMSAADDPEERLQLNLSLMQRENSPVFEHPLPSGFLCED